MSQNYFKIFKAMTKYDPNIKKIGNVLGHGPHSEVRDIIMNKNKKYAGKLIEIQKNQNSDEKFLKGKNIVNIHKIISKTLKDKYYELILMEKAVLRDLGTLNSAYFNRKILNHIYNPFDEILGDNFLRFFAKQIINALNSFKEYNYIHNDIKPQNILVTFQLILKLTYFPLLTKVKDKETIIPGGTTGYLPPEYYKNSQVDSKVARKQDYFALGSTLYFLKYGEQMLKYNDKNETIVIADEIVELLEKQRDNIKSGKLFDREFINFLCSLIEYKPEDRPCFEEIYRNIWLNKNSKQIKNIYSINLGEEEKMMVEFQKSDFLIQIEKEIEKDLNLENEIKSKENKNVKKDANKKKKNNLCRFRFKKK